MTHRTCRTVARRIAVGVLATGLMATQAQARVGQICLELPAGAGTLKAEIASGCLPTSPAYEGAFAVQVDAHTATITINGGFTQVGDARIGTTDCMGSRVIEQEAKAAGPRRYSVIVNNRHVGAIDASDTQFGMRAVRRCFAGRSQVQVPSSDTMATYSISQFSDWIGRDEGKPAPITASTLGGLAAQLLGDHPESQEGRPSAKIEISPAQWQRRPWDKQTDRTFMAIRIEEHGYLDDSVSGRRTFATARRDTQTGEWSITGLWRQFMCARGEKAGQWSSEPCA
ncbi:MAG: hypothetical protein QNJ15_03770 [Erythrobacter sp.]|nr:hypothetical protein [Erythrobacter sp.]